MADTGTGVRKDNNYGPSPERTFSKSSSELIRFKKAMSMEMLGEKVGTVKSQHGRQTHERNK